jgi:hypothetical protein
MKMRGFEWAGGKPKATGASEAVSKESGFEGGTVPSSEKIERTLPATMKNAEDLARTLDPDDIIYIPGSVGGAFKRVRAGDLVAELKRLNLTPDSKMMIERK